MIKKVTLILFTVILVLCLAACAGNQSSNTDNKAAVESTAEPVVSKETEQPKAETGPEAIKQSSNAEWPDEFSAWDIPVPAKGRVTSSDNRSVSGGMFTQGVNVIVNLSDLSKSDFDAYCGELESKGFIKDPSSLADVMLVYEKAVGVSTLKLTLSYSESGTTIVANNPSAADNKESAGTGAAGWPQSLKEIPEFSKGSYKETVELGGGMYAITFTGVSDADIDWYRNTLINSGFERQPSPDTEGYMKMGSNTAYSVGFVLSDGVLQLVIASGTF